MRHRLLGRARPAAFTVLVIAAAACADDPSGPRLAAMSDSLLIARLAGEMETADTVRLSWRGVGGDVGTWLEVTRGPLVVSASGVPHFTARGSRADTVYSSPPLMMLPSVDSLPITFWLSGDSLIGLWTPARVPRAAVTDSGLHWGTTDPASMACALYLGLFVPEGATAPACRVAVHWRRRQATP